MKFAAFALCLVALTLGFGIGVVAFPEEESRGDDGEGLRRELEAQARELRELRRQVEQLRRQPLALGVVERESELERLPELRELPRTSTPAEPGALDPRLLLERWLASFEGGGQGAEFFRMAVAAHARELAEELAVLAGDLRSPPELRRQVLEMLGLPVFRGAAGALQALLAVFRDADPPGLAQTALHSLARIGDAVTAEALCASCPHLRSLELREATWPVVLQLAGDQAGRLLLQLFQQERDPGAQARMIALFEGTAGAEALAAYTQASTMALEVRDGAAERIGNWRSPEFVSLTRSWVSREPDEGVRTKLRAALQSQQQIPRWHELQTVGPPDAARIDQDSERAWAPARADAGREWLVLGYETAIPADRIVVHEICVGGAVIEVEIHEGGSWRSVWQGRDPTRAAGPLEIRFSLSAQAVDKVRVVLDTRLASGWNEIDAVLLAGPEGEAWASSATASSRYASNPGNAWGAASLEEAAELLQMLKESR